MNIFISIDGVLRNFVNRYHYHYEQAYIDVDVIENDDTFEYRIIEPIINENLSNTFIFQSKEQQNYFQYIEYPMELYGHSPVSYSNVNNDLNKIIFENKNHNITIVGLDEFGKARPATFFFLSKNGFMINNLKFITTENLNKEWENVDVWISDSKKILDTKPENKEFILFQHNYNNFFTHNKKINKLSDIIISDSNDIKFLDLNDKINNNNLIENEK